MNARIDIRYSDEHADTAVGQLLGPFDLVEISRGIVVDGGPEQVAQVGKAVGSGEGGLRLDSGQFRVGSGRKVGLKSVLDHGGVCRGNQIEMKRMVGMHLRSCSWARNASLTRRGRPEQQVSESASQHLIRHRVGRGLFRTVYGK